MTIRIVADENIPYVREAFSTLGEVRVVSGRQMTHELVEDADVLAVRSITRVDSALLEDTDVSFVGTATIGTDHVDLDYLDDEEIDFASAPGSNATSVAEYVVAALLVLSREMGFELSGKSLGVIGVGNVGSLVAARAEALGMHVVRNDPPLARRTGNPVYRPIDEVMDCDIVTFHVPLTHEGEDATWHMGDRLFLQELKPGAIVINTSRGAVIDGKALKEALDDDHVSEAVLDVWENEPAIDLGLLERTIVGTPHIAGYSFDGKVAGMMMIYEAACQSMEEPATFDVSTVLPAVDDATVDLTDEELTTMQQVERAVMHSYPIMRDDAALRKLMDTPKAERAETFDRLRKEYPARREFANYTVVGADATASKILKSLGFKLA